MISTTLLSTPTSKSPFLYNHCICKQKGSWTNIKQKQYLKVYKWLNIYSIRDYLIQSYHLILQRVFWVSESNTSPPPTPKKKKEKKINCFTNGWDPIGRCFGLYSYEFNFHYRWTYILISQFVQWGWWGGDDFSSSGRQSSIILHSPNYRTILVRQLQSLHSPNYTLPFQFHANEEAISVWSLHAPNYSTFLVPLPQFYVTRKSITMLLLIL